MVAYNRLNTAILAISENHQDYLHLRLSASVDEILKRVGDSQLPDSLKEIWQNEEYRNVWKYFVREENLKDFFQLPPGSELTKYAFKDANYLWYPEQYEKLAKMAREGRIESQVVNIKDTQRTAEIVESVKKKNLKLAVLDLSNAYTPGYAGEDASEVFAREFSKVSTDDSIFLITSYKSMTSVHGPYVRREIIDQRFDATNNLWQKYDHSAYLGIRYGDLPADRDQQFIFDMVSSMRKNKKAPGDEEVFFYFVDRSSLPSAPAVPAKGENPSVSPKSEEMPRDLAPEPPAERKWPMARLNEMISCLIGGKR